MNTEIRMWMLFLATLYQDTRARMKADERGIAAETILIALMAAGAVVVGGIIVTKVVGKANSIPTGP